MRGGVTRRRGTSASPAEPSCDIRFRVDCRRGRLRRHLYDSAPTASSGSVMAVPQRRFQRRPATLAKMRRPDFEIVGINHSVAVAVGTP